jgi:hypothetical protein
MSYGNFCAACYSEEASAETAKPKASWCRPGRSNFTLSIVICEAIVLVKAWASSRYCVQLNATRFSRRGYDFSKFPLTLPPSLPLEQMTYDRAMAYRQTNSISNSSSLVTRSGSCAKKYTLASISPLKLIFQRP